MIVLSELFDESDLFVRSLPTVERYASGPGRFWVTDHDCNSIIYGICGSGAENAQAAAEYCLRRFGIQPVVVFGYCTALSPKTQSGDIVVAKTCSAPAGQEFESDLDLRGLLMCHASAQVNKVAWSSWFQPRVREVSIVTVSDDMTGTSSSLSDLAESGYDCADMVLSNVAVELVKRGAPFGALHISSSVPTRANPRLRISKALAVAAINACSRSLNASARAAVEADS